MVVYGDQAFSWARVVRCGHARMMIPIITMTRWAHYMFCCLAWPTALRFVTPSCSAGARALGAGEKLRDLARAHSVACFRQRRQLADAGMQH